MAKAKSKQRRSLGYMTIQRFVVVGCDSKKRASKKRVYTSVVDAMVVARRCSGDATKHIDVLYGLPGAEGRIATCSQRKCKTPGGKSIPMRKLYDAEQRGPAAAAFDEQRRKDRGGSSGHVPAKAKKTKAKKKKLAPWKALLIARAKSRKAG